MDNIQLSKTYRSPKSNQISGLTEMKTQRNSSKGSKKSKRTNEDSLSQNLIDKSDMKESQQSLGHSSSRLTLLKEWLGQVQTCNRIISFDGEVIPQNYQSNLVKNTKYNPITFVPKVLYNQFKFFFNMFFLVTALSQLIEILRVGLFITYIGPLVLVLSLTMAKEGYDDYNTFKRDIEANSKVYQVLRRTGGKVKLKSKDLRIGDIVLLEKGDKIPADMLILYSDNDQGTLFLKTDQLDGETDWKLRKAVKKTQSMVNSEEDFDSLLDADLKVEVKPPASEIYSFSGVFVYNEIKQRLSLENTMWTSTVLTNGTVLGLVMYVGRQTRISMGSSTARTKVGILDLEINWLSKVLFLLLLGMTVMFLLLQWTQPEYLLIQFMRMTILLSSIIPISMRVNLDFAKLFYSYGINNDRNIPETIVRNSTIPEQLGRVRYVLSDKTGTLTQNEMIFKRISIEDQIKYTEDHIQEIKSILVDYDEIPDGVYSKEKCLKEIVKALVLCHNVTPVYSEDKSTKEFQASSPDQITFVKIAQEFGFVILERTQTEIRVQLPNGKEMHSEILYSFPFKSETKRMGIVLRNKVVSKDGQLNGKGDGEEIVFYLKGADAVMRQFVNNRQKRGFIDQECKDLSMTGLRTLVITKKILKKQFFDRWSAKYDEEYNKMEPDAKAIQKIMDELESNVEFLGITGIEDKLQEDLKDAIQSLKSANIKIWMITGDKIQTAECIGRSCGLQDVTESNVKIENITTPALWKIHWQKVKNNLSRVLIIDGKTLGFVLQDKERSKDFFIYAMQMPSVICCRCSPQQKRTLTQGVKANKKKGEKSSVLGIGDGGNDVGMIQAADLGVGIVGKEGKQAALAADFSIMKFKYVTTLLLWHGRLSYKRSALLASFIIHRGFILSVIQLIFSCVFFYVSIPAFNSYLSLGFTTFFTFWPVFSLILDTDIDRKNAMKYPKLYDSLQSSNMLSTTKFLSWLWKASFQGGIIMLLSMVIFMDTSYLQIETICFTVLIITEYFMTFSEINRLHTFMIVCVVGSLLTYAAGIFFLQDIIHVSSLTLVDLVFICLIVAASWGPIFVWKIVRKTIWPTDYEKVMKTVKRKPIENKIFENSFLEETDTPGISGIIKEQRAKYYKQKNARGKKDLQRLKEEDEESDFSENYSENSEK